MQKANKIRFHYIMLQYIVIVPSISVAAEQFPKIRSAPVATRSPDCIENGFLRQLFRRLPTVALLLSVKLTLTLLKALGGWVGGTSVPLYTWQQKMEALQIFAKHTSQLGGGLLRWFWYQDLKAPLGYCCLQHHGAVPVQAMLLQLRDQCLTRV